MQPIAVSEDAPAGSSTDAIVRENAKYFPHDREIFSYGYEQILKVRGDRYLNASSLMRNVPDTYLDVVHLSKVGNAKLGSFFYSAVKAVVGGIDASTQGQQTSADTDANEPAIETHR